MAAAAPIIGLAATGISALGSFSGASAASQGYKVQAQNAVDAAQIGQTKAAETDTDMRRHLTVQLANIGAIRAGAGLVPNSPTGAAIENQVQGVSALSRTQAVQNIQNQVALDQRASQFYTSAASSALMGGELGAAGSIFTAAGKSNLFSPNGMLGGLPGMAGL